MELNKYIDHINLNSKATLRDIEKLCNEVIKNKFASACVLPYYVSLASSLLKDTNIEVCTAVGFPLGMNTVSTKSYEAIEAVNNGAAEIDMAINIGALKNKDYDYIKEEIEEVRDAIDGKVLKVMIDSNNLAKEEIIKMVEICNDTFVNYIHLNFNDNIDKEIIELINKYKSDILNIYVSGDIKKIDDIYELIELGIDRISTNNIIEIMRSEKSEII